MIEIYKNSFLWPLLNKIKDTTKGKFIGVKIALNFSFTISIVEMNM